jgi:zinc and cadmium transporter
MLSYILISTGLISLAALIGIFTLAMREQLLGKILLFLVSLSAGALMGGAFIHLLPEAVEGLEPNTAFMIVLGSFIVFFLIEKVLRWRHCHKAEGECDVHTFGYINLMGDSVHNFIDGLIIAGAFLVDTSLGIVVAIAVALHEIPQEIGDFGVLLYSGFSKYKALLANFLVALTVVLGGIVGYYLSFWAEGVVPYLIPVAAGGFIYIAASDLLPEIRKEHSFKRSAASLAVFLLGIALMYSLTLIEIGH